MTHTLRHDALALQPGVDAAAFERFMTDELLPHLAERFKGPTRASKADLKHMALLRDAKSARRFVLVTAWDGAPSAVGGGAFENARMNTSDETDTLIAKLERYAKRSAEKVFHELASIEVPTNR